jgi:phage replication-related protein YjqB (UPF0714/DUF867 family)
MGDKYSGFAQLAAHERLGIDYQIRVHDRGSMVAVIAPHGGRIEPGSSEIATAVADGDLSLYSFEGIRRGRANGDLHITSSRFDEPQALGLIAAVETAIAIHGRADSKDPAIWVGGRDFKLRDAVIAGLNAAGFEARLCVGRLAGTDPANICNRTASGAGVQLELPRSLRDSLLTDPELMQVFAGAVRRAFAERAAV